jgi:hypothetical protein
MTVSRRFRRRRTARRLALKSAASAAVLAAAALLPAGASAHEAWNALQQAVAADAEEVDDGLPGEEGAFLLSSFDVVSALVVAGRVDEARDRFEWLCSRAGPLGLFSEEMAADGTALGNYPQAFTHLALITAAVNLDSAGDGEALHAWAERYRENR